MPYLAGYLADKYDVSEEESVGRANKRVKNRQKKHLRLLSKVILL